MKPRTRQATRLCHQGLVTAVLPAQEPPTEISLWESRTLLTSPQHTKPTSLLDLELLALQPSSPQPVTPLVQLMNTLSLARSKCRRKTTTTTTA